MQFASKWVATLLFSAVQPIYVYSVIKSVKFCGSSGCDNLAEKLVVMAAPGTLSLVWLCCLIYFVRSISGWTQILLPSATGVVFFFGAALVLGDMNSGTKPPNAAPPMATAPMATSPTAMTPLAIRRRCVRGSIPLAMCSSGQPNSVAGERYS